MAGNVADMKTVNREFQYQVAPTHPGQPILHTARTFKRNCIKYSGSVDPSLLSKQKLN